MRALLAVLAMAVCSTALAAPVKDPPPPPYAILDFFASPDAWEMTLKLTTVSGATYELHIEHGNRGNVYRMATQRELIRANWCAEMSGDQSIHIYGVRTKDGKADAVKSLVLTNRIQRGKGRTPELKEGRNVKVDTRIDKDKEKPAREGKQPLPGPDIRDESFVEFDFSPFPENVNKIHLSYRIDTTDPTQYFKDQLSGGIGTRADLCALLEDALNEIGYKAEVVEKTKLRVYGNIRQNRFYPATKGSVDCEELKPDQLPKITNPKRS